MPFPRDRFARAGASAEQLEELEESYEKLSAEAQSSYDASLAPLSDGEIAARFLADVAEPVEEDTEPEPIAPAQSSSGSGNAASGSGSAIPLGGSSSSA